MADAFFEAEVAPGTPVGGSPNSEEQNLMSVRDQDRFLPIANVGRIMKKVLPPNGKISKDAKDMVQECVSEFISFVTSEATEKCQREQKKTISGDDLLRSMSTLGFADYIEPLRLYLSKYREMEDDTKGSGKSSDRYGYAQFGPGSQLTHQGSFTQGMSYGNFQPPGQH